MQHGSPSLMLFKWAVRFAASHENVMLVLSRMSNLEQLRDNISYMGNFIPFTEEEYILVKKRGRYHQQQHCNIMYWVCLLS